MLIGHHRLNGSAEVFFEVKSGYHAFRYKGVAAIEVVAKRKCICKSSVEGLVTHSDRIIRAIALKIIETP